MASTTAGNTNKRPRRSGGDASPGGPCLVDLPHVLLAHAADYLPDTARALWASALTAPSEAWEESNWQLRPSVAGEAVLGRRWAVTALDFMDVGRDCCKQLSDGDVGAVLVCLGARDDLRSLKLTHCVGITGSGLEPLRGSTALKQIDLSLVEQHESPAIDPLPAIDESAAIPILDTIIAAEGSSLVHIQLPKKWRDRRSKVLTQFLLRYNRFKDEQSIDCSYWRNSDDDHVFCTNTCQGTDEMPWVHFATEHESYFGMHYYGIQFLTCYQCLNAYCLECSAGDDGDQIDFCTQCEKYYCVDCKHVDFCQARGCLQRSPVQKSSCQECAKIKVCDMCVRECCADCDPSMQCGVLVHIAKKTGALAQLINVKAGIVASKQFAGNASRKKNYTTCQKLCHWGGSVKSTLAAHASVYFVIFAW